MVFFSKSDAIRGRRCGARLARNEDGLVGRFPPRECGTHLAVGLVGDGEAVGRRRLRGFRVRGSQRAGSPLRLDGVFIIQARKALEGVHR